MKAGKNCALKLGTFNVQGMGKWSIPGVKWDLLDATQFGDQMKQFLFGLGDGGEISFSGKMYSPDPGGQDALRTANLNQSQLTNLFFYQDATSYWALATSAYPSSYLLVTAWKIDADASGLLQSDYTVKVCGGAMQLN
jgi:hypothetical protein